MKKSELEKYLDKNVEIKIFDGSMYAGILYKTGDERFKDNPNLYIPKNRYFVSVDGINTNSCIFRCSHVVKLKEE